MTFLLPVVAALVSLVILPGWSFSFDVIPKVVVILAGAALALAFSRETRVPPTDALKSFGILAAAQAATIGIATLFSTHRKLSLLGSAWRKDGVLAELAVLVLAVVVALHLAAGRAHLRPWLRITVLAALPVAIYGIFQYFGIDPWIPPSGYHFGEGQFTIVRPPSTLGHAAYFATYLLYAVFGGVALAQSETAQAWKAAGLATSVIAGFAIVLSGTRGALAGLVIGALFVAMRERLNWRWLAGGLALMAMMAAFYVSPAGERLRARVHWSSEDPLGGSRLLLWRDTLRMSGGRLLAGYGPETFAVEFPRYQSLELARAYPDFYHESPHNIFVDALVSKGILGLLPLVALAVLGLKLARGPMGGAFVAILVSQQFIAFTVPTELYFYLCLAILADKKEKKGSDDFSPSRALAAVEKVVCPLFLGCFAVYLAAGDALLGSARRALDRGDVAAAVESVDRARKWNASADIYFSRRLLNVKAFEPALETAQHATQTADDPQNAWVNLAAFYAVQNNAAAVELSLRQAIAAAPNWYKSHWLLAQVLDREGRLAEAKAEAQAAVERNGGKTPEVTQVWEQLKRR